MSARVHVFGVLIVVLTSWAAVYIDAQTLPPVGTDPLPAPEYLRSIRGAEAKTRALAALNALVDGNLAGAMRQLKGKDEVIDLPSLASEGLSKQDLGLVEALYYYTHGDMRRTYEVATALRKDQDVDWDHSNTAGGLLAFTFWRLQVMPVAQNYGAPLLWAVPVGSNRPTTPFGGRVFSDILNDAGVAKYPSEDLLQSVNPRRIEVFQCEQPGIQPWACVWFSGRDFVGALTITDSAYGTGEKPNYRLVYRDLDGPPITIMELGEQLPDTKPIEQFAAEFRSDPGERGKPRPLRVQMEASWFARAHIAPLAALWSAQDSSENPTPALQEIHDKLAAAKNVRWNLIGRLHTRQTPRYEVAVYVNRDATRAEDLPYYGSDAADANLKTSLPLEHVYCVLAMPKDRRYVASYRLVSDPVGEDGNRLYRYELVQGDTISVLHVTTEYPRYPLDTFMSFMFIASEPVLEGFRSVPFEEADTSEGPLRGQALRTFFEKHGIELGDVQAGTEVEIKAMPAYTVSPRSDYFSQAAFVNQLRMTGTDANGSFTLRLPGPVNEVNLMRDLFSPRDLDGSRVSTEPAWRMTALDEAGRVVDWIAEGASSTRDSGDGTLPMTYLMICGQGIVAVRIDCMLAGSDWDLRGNLYFRRMVRTEQEPASTAAP